MSRLANTLNSGEFAVTCELNPPKGIDLTGLFEKSEALKDIAIAINVTAVSYTHLTLPTKA